MSDARGLSLIEVLLAMALIAIAVLALATMFLSAYGNVETGGERTALVTLGQQRIEWLRNQPLFRLPAGTTSEPLTDMFHGYVRTTVIDDDVPAAGIKRIAVTTTSPAGHGVTLVTLVTD